MARPIDYSKGKIYRINCADLVYIGSTVQALSMRMTGHRRDYKAWLNGKYHYISSFKLFKLGDPVITLIEDYPCDRKEQLISRERFHIENNDCVNKKIPGRTMAEYYEDNKEAIIERVKEYRKNNREVIAEKQAEYRELNKGAIAEKMKKYYEANKEAIVEKTKKYYEDNKEAILEKEKEYREANKDEINRKKREAYVKQKASIV